MPYEKKGENHIVEAVSVMDDGYHMEVAQLGNKKVYYICDKENKRIAKIIQEIIILKKWIEEEGETQNGKM